MQLRIDIYWLLMLNLLVYWLLMVNYSNYLWCSIEYNRIDKILFSHNQKASPGGPSIHIHRLIGSKGKRRSIGCFFWAFPKNKDFQRWWKLGNFDQKVDDRKNKTSRGIMGMEPWIIYILNLRLYKKIIYLNQTSASIFSIPYDQSNFHYSIDHPIKNKKTSRINHPIDLLIIN